MQTVFVITAHTEAHEGTLYRFENDVPVGSPIPVTVGEKGLTFYKKEGDKKSPAGMFALGSVFGFERACATKMPYLFLEEGLVCVDDPESALYNCFAHQKECSWQSAERMWEEPLYRLGLVIRYNTDPVVKGAGSCIFMHVWRGPGLGTAGCVAMAEEDLRTLVLWLDPTKNPRIILLSV